MKRYLIKTKKQLEKSDKYQGMKFHIDDVFGNGNHFEVYIADDKYLKDYKQNGGLWEYDNTYDEVVAIL